MLKKILIALAALIALLLIISFFLPSKVHVERSLVINAPANILFDQVNDVAKQVSWSPWLQKDPNANVELGTPKKGKGAFYKWTSDHPEVGNGMLTIMESQPPSFIRQELDFYENGKAEAGWKFEDVNQRIKVTWTFDTDLGMNPISRYQGLFFDKFIGPSMEQGLRNLRDAAEKSSGSRDVAAATLGSSAGEMEVQEIDFPGQEYVAVRRTINMRDMEGMFATYFPLLYNKVQMEAIEINGEATALFYDWNETNGTVDVAAAMPVKEGRDLDAQMKSIKIPPGKALLVVYQGPMENISKAHLAIQQYVQARQLKQKSPIIEEYLSHAAIEPDPNKAITKVYCLLQ